MRGSGFPGRRPLSGHKPAGPVVVEGRIRNGRVEDRLVADLGLVRQPEGRSGEQDQGEDQPVGAAGGPLRPSVFLLRDGAHPHFGAGGGAAESRRPASGTREAYHPGRRGQRGSRIPVCYSGGAAGSPGGTVGGGRRAMRAPRSRSILAVLPVFLLSLFPTGGCGPGRTAAEPPPHHRRYASPRSARLRRPFAPDEREHRPPRRRRPRLHESLQPGRLDPPLDGDDPDRPLSEGPQGDRSPLSDGWLAPDPRLDPAGEGYDTRGYVSHVLLTSQYGLDKGFARFDASVLDRGDPHRISTSKELTDLALSDLRNLREPFFVWVHYFDPHFAYLPHPEWASFGDGEIDRYDQEIAHTDARSGASRLLRRAEGAERTVASLRRTRGGVRRARRHLPRDVLRGGRARAASGRGPGVAPSRCEDPVDQVDLLPTMLGLLGVPLPGPSRARRRIGASLPEADLHRAGSSLRVPPAGGSPFVQQARSVEPRDTTLVPPESRAQDTEAKNVVPGTRLYDLGADPEERFDSSAGEADRTESLLALLADHFLGAVEPGETVVVDEAMREKLRALGYLR